MGPETSHQPSARDLFWFEVSVDAAFVALAGLLFHWGHRGFGVALLGLTALGLLLFRVIPASRRVVFIGWSAATRPVGYAVSRGLLLAIYFLVVTPTGLILRLAGRSALERGFDRSTSSYFHDAPSDIPVERYFRPF